MTIMVTMDGIRLAFVLCCSALISSTSLGQLLLQPASPQAYFTGEDFAVTCYAPLGGNDVSQMMWRSPTGHISDTEGRIHVEPDKEDGRPSLRLLVQGTLQTDAGDYVCSAKVDEEHLKATFKLLVYRSITFAGTPEEQVTTEGEDANILCHAVADPLPIFTWTLNGSTINSGGRYLKTKAGLQIRNATRADEGIYTCRAILIAAKNSQVKTIDISLRVQYAPEWHEPHMVQAYSSVGSTTDLVCEAHGFPAPSYSWLRDGEVIEDCDIYNVTHQKGKSILHVVVTNDSQFGDYLCRASNKLDSKERIVTLVEGETPKVPLVDVSRSEPGKLFLKLSPEEVSNSAASDELKVLGFRVQFRPYSAPWHAAKSRDFTIDDDFVLNGLDRSEEYVVRVAARNAAGFSPFSDEIRHRTQPMTSATVRDASDGSQTVFLHSWALLHFCSLLSAAYLWALPRF